MKSLACMTAMALIASAPAFAQKMDNAEVAALKQLAQADLNEIDAGKAAAAKASRAEVKQFAQKMADDHSKMLEDLQALARRKGVALPESASLKDKAKMAWMERASGPQFDEKYIEEMVKDHREDAKETQDLAAKAKDPDFKRALEQAKAKIDEHLRLAQGIAARTGAAGGSAR